MTDHAPDPGTGGGAGADGVHALDPQQLVTYFVLTEAVSLLQYQVEQQLRAEGDLSYVQFQLLARLADAHGPLTMTQLADGVVYSRSGLTYQAGLGKAASSPAAPALTTNAPPWSPSPTTAWPSSTASSPGHVQVIRRLLLDPLSGDDLHHLGDIMTPVPRPHARPGHPALPPPGNTARVPPPRPRPRSRRPEPKFPAASPARPRSKAISAPRRGPPERPVLARHRSAARCRKRRVKSAGEPRPPAALRTGRDGLPSSGPHSPALGERDAARARGRPSITARWRRSGRRGRSAHRPPDSVGSGIRTCPPPTAQG